MDVFSDCDGFISVSDCGLAYRQTYDDRFNFQDDHQSSEPPAAAERVGFFAATVVRVTQAKFLEIYRKVTAFAHQLVMLELVGTIGLLNAFFGSLKHDWIFKVAQLLRYHMRSDMAAYIKYYNLHQLHTVNGEMSPVHFETSKHKVSSFA